MICTMIYRLLWLIILRLAFLRFILLWLAICRNWSFLFGTVHLYPLCIVYLPEKNNNYSYQPSKTDFT